VAASPPCAHRHDSIMRNMRSQREISAGGTMPSSEPQAHRGFALLTALHQHGTQPHCGSRIANTLQAGTRCLCYIAELICISNRCDGVGSRWHRLTSTTRLS
jgi:hypothetical protein